MRGDREIGALRPGLARPGQRALRRFDFGDFIRAAPGLVPALAKMPASRVTLEANGDAEVACNCGALPLRVPTALSAVCECRRTFIHFGHGDVRGLRLDPEE